MRRYTKMQTNLIALVAFVVHVFEVANEVPSHGGSSGEVLVAFGADMMHGGVFYMLREGPCGLVPASAAFAKV